MSPRKLTITPDRVLEAALGVVRRAGLQALTARSVAQELGVSVVPIYRVYASMEELTQAVIDAALAEFAEHKSRQYTDMPFRNAGVALVMFACEEPQLYRALFLEPHPTMDVFGPLLRQLHETLAHTPELGRLPRAMRDELVMDLWVYTHGLASMIVAGILPSPKPAVVDRKLTRVGAIVIGAAMTATLEPVDMFGHEATGGAAPAHRRPRGKKA
jgi:AcrR family transcriptional regulator